MNNIPFDRRKFLKSGALLSFAATTAGLFGFNNHASAAPHLMDESLYMIGPREGYTPYIGSLVSMMNYNRSTIINLTKGMTMEQLDHLQDAQSNTVGALLMHLASVDKIYYVLTIDKRADFNEEEKKMWGDGMELGDKGRQNIKGKELSYYVDLLTTTREQTLKAFKTKDDAWLLAEDDTFSKGNKFNNYWKWFHVCEHESHHRGQISWLKKRIPGMAAGND
ncbi:MAG TPA: DinB family protein [Puia sp.]|nr:DinB family protein [Puia sp.]